MKKLLHNIKIKTKLITGFILVLLFIVFLGLRQYKSLYIIAEFSEKNKQLTELLHQISVISQSNQTSENLVLQIRMAQSKSEIDTLWKKYATQAAVIEDATEKMSEINDTIQWEQNENSLHEKIAELLFNIQATTENVINEHASKIKNIQNGLIRQKAAIATIPPPPASEMQPSPTDAPSGTDATTDELLAQTQTPQPPLHERATMLRYTKAQQEHYNYLKNNSVELQNSIAAVQEKIKHTSHTYLEKQEAYTAKNRKNTLFFILAGIIFTLAVAFNLSRLVAMPIKNISEFVEELSDGELPEKLSFSSKNEIGVMVKSLNKLNENLQRTKDFANDVGAGNFETKINVFNNQGALGSALAGMRDSLYKVAKDREKQQFEEAQRNWATQGLAKFAEILRHNNDNISELSFNITKNMVYYLNAIQGGLFVINDNDVNDVYIEMVSSFAYDRKKSTQKRIELNEGIVGRCVGENETVYMTNVPDSYVNITSGLGKANPRSLLVVPLKLNDEVFGVIEIASFQPFEPYQIDFVEKVSESIASTLSTVKINAQTAALLEQAQENAEEMAAQEEEMRQNLEELQATQDEAARKEALAHSFVNSVNHTMIRADFTADGHLLYANSRFLETMDYSSPEITDKPHSIFIRTEDKEFFEKVWSTLSKGGRHFEGIVLYKTKTGTVWLLSTYTVVRNPEGGVAKILYLAFDISELKNKQIENEKKAQDMQQLYEKEIENMYNQWYNQLNTMHNELKQKRNNPHSRPKTIDF